MNIKHLGNIYVPKEKVQELLDWRADVRITQCGNLGSQYLFIKNKVGDFTYYELQHRINYVWFKDGEKESDNYPIVFLECHSGDLVVHSLKSWAGNYLIDLILEGIVKQFGRKEYHVKDDEQALKDYETIKKDFVSLRDFKYNQLDALNIIVKNNVDISILKSCENASDYNYAITGLKTSLYLTDEDFAIVKGACNDLVD